MPVSLCYRLSVPSSYRSHDSLHSATRYTTLSRYHPFEIPPFRGWSLASRRIGDYSVVKSAAPGVPRHRTRNTRRYPAAWAANSGRGYAGARRNWLEELKAKLPPWAIVPKVPAMQSPLHSAVFASRAFASRLSFMLGTELHLANITQLQRLPLGTRDAGTNVLDLAERLGLLDYLRSSPSAASSVGSEMEKTAGRSCGWQLKRWAPTPGRPPTPWKGVKPGSSYMASPLGLGVADCSTQPPSTNCAIRSSNPSSSRKRPEVGKS